MEKDVVERLKRKINAQAKELSDVTRQLQHRDRHRCCAERAGLAVSSSTPRPAPEPMPTPQAAVERTHAAVVTEQGRIRALQEEANTERKAREAAEQRIAALEAALASEMGGSVIQRDDTRLADASAAQAASENFRRAEQQRIALLAAREELKATKEQCAKLARQAAAMGCTGGSGTRAAATTPVRLERNGMAQPNDEAAVLRAEKEALLEYVQQLLDKAREHREATASSPQASQPRSQLQNPSFVSGPDALLAEGSAESLRAELLTERQETVKLRAEIAARDSEAAEMGRLHAEALTQLRAALQERESRDRRVSEAQAAAVQMRMELQAREAEVHEMEQRCRALDAAVELASAEKEEVLARENALQAELGRAAALAERQHNLLLQLEAGATAQRSDHQRSTWAAGRAAMDTLAELSAGLEEVMLDLPTESLRKRVSVGLRTHDVAVRDATAAAAAAAAAATAEPCEGMPRLRAAAGGEGRSNTYQESVVWNDEAWQAAVQLASLAHEALAALAGFSAAAEPAPAASRRRTARAAWDDSKAADAADTGRFADRRPLRTQGEQEQQAQLSGQQQHQQQQGEEALSYRVRRQTAADPSDSRNNRLTFVRAGSFEVAGDSEGIFVRSSAKSRCENVPPRSYGGASRNSSSNFNTNALRAARATVISDSGSELLLVSSPKGRGSTVRVHRSGSFDVDVSDEAGNEKVGGGGGAASDESDDAWHLGELRRLERIRRGRKPTRERAAAASGLASAAAAAGGRQRQDAAAVAVARCSPADVSGAAKRLHRQLRDAQQKLAAIRREEAVAA